MSKEKNVIFTEQNAKAYKFKIEMVVSLFAENNFQASEVLDAEGGFIVSRKVTLLDTIPVHNKEKSEKE